MQKTADIHKYLEKHPARAEYEFLFACCRAAFAGTTIRYHEDIDKDRFLAILRHHKLITQLYPFFKDSCKNLPSSLLFIFQDFVKKNTLRVMQLTRELFRLSEIFDQQNIPWISLKGPVLSLQLYGDIAVRQAGDLDILINEQYLERAINVLMKAGYIPTIDHTAFNTTQIGYWRKYFKDESFIHTSEKIHLELHWRLMLNQNMPLNNDSLEKKQILLENRKLYSLDNTTNMLYLCMHGSHHGWFRLFWLWDIAVLLTGMNEQETERFIKIADKYKLKDEVGQAFTLVKMIFGVNTTGFEPSAHMIKISRMAFRYILDPAIMTLSRTHIRVSYELKNHFFNNFQYVLMTNLTNPVHWKTIRLPEYLFFLYYILRPVAAIKRKFLSKKSN